MSITKANTFESGQAVGTALTPGASGNTAPGGAPFTAVTVGQGCSATYVTAPIRSGLAGRMFAAGGASAYVEWTETTAAQPAVYIRGYFQFRKFHTGNVTLITARGAEAAGGYILRVSSTGILQLVQNTATQVVLTTGATALALNTWYRIELYLDRTGGWGLRVMLNDTYTPLFSELGGSGAAPNMAGNFTVLRFGLEGAALQAEVYLDDIAYGNDWIGPLPASASSAVAMSGMDPGWAPVGSNSLVEAVADDDVATYIQSPGLTSGFQPIKFRLGELKAGDLSIRVRLGGDALPDARVRLMQGTTIIATWNTLNLPAAGAEYEYALTAAQASTITDRANLHLEIAGVL